ncbi:MAG TPA: DUF4380 domain-containing protein [Candidatus Limnocylindria bacterium]|jgi:hypothetical protein|nr:DUF4380 domain-containing protein [Candidatus Limnocylindria bacterium]
MRRLFPWLAAPAWVALSLSVVAASTASKRNHAGWADALWLENGTVEAVIVPSIGRIMQFRFKGGEDVFWENPVKQGKAMVSNAWATPGSFGGDKTWPAPQSKWNWPPPDIFDAAPLKAEIKGETVVLRSPVSPRFGIKTERRVHLHPTAAEMTIETTYVKTQGDPVEVGVWVITQVVDPEIACLPVPKNSKFATGLTSEWGDPTKMAGVKAADGYATITRLAAAPRKIGNDAESIAWVGKQTVLRIDSPRIPGATYPDDGCSSEIYTNNDPAKYIEMEMVGPLSTMKVGDRLSSTNTYRLFHRTEADPEKAAREALRK